MTRDPLAGRLTVSVVTGFLGSGKTTLIRRLLTHPGMNRVAVVINEFGEVGIDSALVAASSESITLLANGCLCCTMRTDLQETLRELFVKRRAGEVIDFDRVVVETTGLADPAPVIQTFASDTLLAAQYQLDGVVTLVDAVNGAVQLDAQVEAVKQAAVADRLLVTKADLAGSAAVQALRARLQALNPHAAVAEAVQGAIDPAFFLDIGLRTARADGAHLDRWLGSSGDAEGYLGNRLATGTHDRAIRSFVLWFDRPFSWSTFTSAMELLTSMRGPDLLRVKGLVNVEGERGPVVVQGVQHIFHPPVTLDAWPDEGRRSRLVFITRNISREAVTALFAAVDGLGG
ncbi:MAG TPA: GTP-binding protein [Burkholderiales bacterium]|nr:GTP-binding protein [Burkholderiales bacterium]